MTGRHYLTYGGRPTTDFGVWISGGGTFDAPERDVEAVAVPGRDGALHIDNGRFQNITVTYPAFIATGFRGNMEALRAYMLSLHGYQRIEDTYHPGFFRMGVLSGGISVSAAALNLAGEFDLSFDCKPQRFLVSGEQAAVIEGSGTVANPTLYESRPLIRAYGAGSITANGSTLEILSADGYTDLDCDLGNAYKGGENRNSHVSGSFPTLAPGINSVTASSGITRLEIRGRWWTT